MSRRVGAVRVVAALLLAGLALGLSGVSAVGAVDDPTEGGLWYYTVPGIGEIHASGVRGAGITVGVIDGPRYPDAPDLVGANVIVHEPSFCDADRDGVAEPAMDRSDDAEHGTSMTSLIAGTGAGINGEPGVRGVAPDATVRHYVRSVVNNYVCKLDGQDGAVLAIDQAIADGVDIISMSWGRNGLSAELADALARAQRAGIILVAASGDLDRRLGFDWPAAANGVVSVEAAGVDRHLRPDAIAHPLLTVVAPGVSIRGLAHDADWQQYGLATGSSPATAWTAGVLALAWSAHPDATANQMIQALLRTTSQSEGELTRRDDHWGYGNVNARKLVAIDPTTLPDENPLLRDDPDARPSIEQILGTSSSVEPQVEATEEPVVGSTPAPTVTTPAVEGSESGSETVVIVVAVVVVLLAAGVTAVLVNRRRSTPAGSPPPPAPISATPPLGG